MKGDKLDSSAENYGQMSKCFAIVLSYKGWPIISETITALITQLPIDRIVIVDNASGDDTPELIKARFPEITFIQSGANDGYAAGMQVGIARASVSGADHLLLLTQECRLEPGAIEKLTVELQTNSSVGCVAPLLGRQTTGQVWSAGGTVSRRSGQPRHLHARQSMATVSCLAPFDAEWADGAALLLRCEALESAGGLDTHYFLYNEEVDLALRLRRAGWSIRIVPQAIAWQEPGEGGIPPYLEVRNRLMLWLRNRKYGLAATAFMFSSYQVALDLRARRWSIAWLRVCGLGDGVTGRLRRSKAAVRYVPAETSST